MNAPTTLKELLPAQGDTRPGVQGKELTHESAVPVHKLARLRPPMNTWPTCISPRTALA